MNLKLEEVYNGFKLINEEEIKEINSLAQVFLHEKSGAKLLFIKNDDDNKIFSISFRTPPKDSTGVAHILEHSVLCGSRKFPVKEPFVELIKGSLNTFLNAMTFPDKTMYPVGSTNDKDFTNLMDVYLDAVLYPNIYKYPEIMMQEGWHYEIENKEDDITYKGVVYNEMKGAFSSPESILFRKIQESLLPDTVYGVESGGDPDYIPDLTQDNFKEFHKKYYHPSNSYIYLYGDLDILEKLKFIDENYLKDFDKEEVDSKIKPQEAFKDPKYVEVKYPISKEEKIEDKTYLSLNFSVGNSTDKELYLAFEILEHILLETPSSPLKKALLEAGLGKDVFGVYDNSILQSTISIIVKNSNNDKVEEFKSVVFNTLENLVKEGIDKKLIESSINIKEFSLREADYQGYPKGLIYNMKSMESWLYDEEPTMHLKYEDVLPKIKSALNSNYFEDLIQRYILDNNHYSVLIVKPEKGLEENRIENIRKKLKEYKDSLTEKELELLIQQTKKLKERQNKKDSMENLSKIPLLSIEDINKEAERLPLEEKNILGIKTLYHNVFTNKISYLNLYFNTRAVEKENIPYIGLLSAVLGKVSTENYNYQDLSNEVNINTGGIRYNAEIFSQKESYEDYTSMFTIKSKCLTSNVKELIKLLSEILTNSKFDEKNRLREIIQELKSRLEMIMFDRGHSVAVKRLFSYFSSYGKYDELLSGVEFYKFIVDIEKNFEDRFEDISKNLQSVFNKIFNSTNLLVSVTGEEEEFSEVNKEFKILYDSLSGEKLQYNNYEFNFDNRNEAFSTSSKVQYVAKGYNYFKLGYEYSGSMQVLRTIVNYDYLWNRIRVQGGAYGAFSSFIKNGNMFFVSYRDPNLIKTIEAYNEAFKYVSEFNPEDREMTKYIIGTISDLDTPLTPAAKGERATENYLRRISYEDRQREREEILATNKEAIKAFSDVIKDLMKENYICVIGNEDKIKENKDKFNNIINLFE
ncbi:insulinase family protein [Clostridium sporogenes]|uniref:insulinase family protein n=1 Tax=Clostridium sporogenes TaxID=1509 RepID=UPI002901D6A3|nr:insulinase family protein [Clostridium botulinum]HDK7168840.1 insulinase family protein [Clostridium botulinum]